MIIIVEADPRIVKRILASLASNFIELGETFRVEEDRVVFDQLRDMEAVKAVCNRISADYSRMAQIHF